MANINPNQINNYKYNKIQQNTFNGLDKQQVAQTANNVAGTAAEKTSLGNDMMWEFVGAGDIDPKKRPAFLAGAVMTGGLIGTGYGKLSDKFIKNEGALSQSVAGKTNNWITKNTQKFSDLITNKLKSKNNKGFRSEIVNSFLKRERPMVYRNKLSMLLRNSAVLDTEKHLADEYISHLETSIKEHFEKTAKDGASADKKIINEKLSNNLIGKNRAKLQKKVLKRRVSMDPAKATEALSNEFEKLSNLKVDLKYGKINPDEAVKQAEAILENKLNSSSKTTGLFKKITESKTAKALTTKRGLLKEAKASKNIFTKAVTKFMLLLDKPLAIRPTGGKFKKLSMMLGVGSFMSAVFIGAPILSGLIHKKGDKVNAQGQEVDEKGNRINSSENKMRRTTSKFAEEFIGFWVFFEPSIRAMYNFTGLKNINPEAANTKLGKFGLKLVKGVGKLFGMGMEGLKSDKLTELYMKKDKKIGTEVAGGYIERNLRKAKNFLFRDTTVTGNLIREEKKNLLKNMSFSKKLASKWGGRAGFIVRNIAIAAMLQPLFSNGVKKMSHLVFGEPAKAKTEEEKAEKSKTQPAQKTQAVNKAEPVAQDLKTMTPMMKEYLNKMKHVPNSTTTPVENTAKPVEKKSMIEKKLDNYTFVPTATPVMYQQRETSKEVLNELNKADKMIGYAEQITETL